MNKIIVIILSAVCFVSCQHEDAEKDVSMDVTMTLSVTDSTWTYVDMERGKVVGYSDISDDVADAEWFARTDWDVAFCGDKIRTNSGTSGKGRGGLQIVEQPYDAVYEVPYDGYYVDSCNVEIW